MRYTQLLIPTVKEVPADAEIASHRLMIRAGFIRKLASGTYTYLPLGVRMLRKAERIVREEMDAAGAQEIIMPILQPMELWQQTGRDIVLQDVMCRFTDHHGRENVLAPTAEEVVTTLVAGEINSYKQLPINLYQINTKFRDELRPQFGVIRSREFLMKDAYSFDADAAGLDETYRKMYDAYRRIFDRCGLKYVIVQAESGGMGGTDTEEFMVPCPVGDVFVTTADGSYAASIEKAEVDPPAEEADLAARREAAAAMEEVHTPGTGTIDAVCSFLGTKPQEMIKTLICWDVPDAEIRKIMGRYLAEHKDGSPNLLDRAAAEAPPSVATYAVLVRGDHQVNEGKLRQLLGESVELVEDDGMVEYVTGAKTGFAGPMGMVGARIVDGMRMDEVSRLIIDQSVAAMGVGVSGANRTDYHTRNVVPGRDFPLEGPNVVVADIRNAVEGDTYQGKRLVFANGVEVGHVFKLGTKYSKQLGATFLDESGAEKPCFMGCYGIGINRILAAAIELGHDDNGCILPIGIAPFAVEVLILNNDNPQVVAEAERIYSELTAAGVEVLLDDRDVRAGVKFKDADLIGIPLRVVVGERGLKEGTVEVKRRTEAKAAAVPAAGAVAEALRIVTDLNEQLDNPG